MTVNCLCSYANAPWNWCSVSTERKLYERKLKANNVWIRLSRTTRNRKEWESQFAQILHDFSSTLNSGWNMEFFNF